ncbi:hypothetical protein Syn7502_02215 [Synechococcus sp. PCC 7502]|nr:hypothetical protein Syn7502_02215 [Synechococcus sp. PCC 7502]
MPAKRYKVRFARIVMTRKGSDIKGSDIIRLIFHDFP